MSYLPCSFDGSIISHKIMSAIILILKYCVFRIFDHKRISIYIVGKITMVFKIIKFKNKEYELRSFQIAMD